jgi:hypothetical protein
MVGEETRNLGLARSKSEMVATTSIESTFKVRMIGNHK